MKNLNGLVIGLSLLFGCLLIVAKIYCLLRWKKTKRRRVMSRESSEEETEEEHGGYAKDLIQLFCFKKPPSLQPCHGGGGEITRNPDGEFCESQDLELGLKRYSGGDEGFEAELIKFHNRRFLFTIKEEVKEEMESDDGISRIGSRSNLGDHALRLNESNFFTPSASPTLKSPSSSSRFESYPHHGLNPLFESEGELELNNGSPPSKFKFLRDAEEKRRKRLMEEEAKKKLESSSTSASPNLESLNEAEGSFLVFISSAINRGNQTLQKSHEPPLSSSPSSQVQILER